MKNNVEQDSSITKSTEKKPLRVGAVIETAAMTEGPSGSILLVQDIKDHFKQEKFDELEEKRRELILKKQHKAAARKKAAQNIVCNGRYSIPGGKIEMYDYVTAGAEELFKREPDKNNQEEVRAFRMVVRHAVCREIEEELNLEVDPESIVPILEIQGGTRDHIICLVQAEGTINILEEELCGIGFLGEQNVIPLNSVFYQAHVRRVYTQYINDARRTEYRAHYLSRLRIPQQLVRNWHQNALFGYAHRHPRAKKRLEEPKKQVSSPNFQIVNRHGEVVNPLELESFTQAKKAKIVPPENHDK